MVGGACASRPSADTSATTRSLQAAAAQEDIAGTFDIGGRKMYIQCTGQGSPTVILISGGGIAADLWDSPLGEHPTVYPTIARTDRVCAYDRPGTTRALAEGGFSRSDPVPQPVTPSVSAAELRALLEAAGETGPFVLAAHSYGGIVARYFANQYPKEVAGMVLVDSFSPELREAMPDLWPSWIAWNTTPPEVIEDYPDYEQVDFDDALDEVVANRTISPMPLVVLTADKPYPPPSKPGIPADINTVTREAQDVSQRQVALLVPGAKHITKTNSGHDIMLENPALVSDAILEVINAVRDGRTSIELDAASRASLDKALDEGFARSGASGATVGVWIPGRGAWVATRGVADRTTSEPMSRDMQAPIGSVTKTYTVLVALQLVGEGRLNLDDTIDRWYPTYPAGDAVTIRMLMNHSSGIAEISQPQLDIKCADPHDAVDPDTIIDISAELPRAAFAPGEGYQYSSANTIVLGRIMEEVTGSSYAELLSQRLFEPLGLTRTRLSANGVLEAPFAHGYTDFTALCDPALPKGTDTAMWTLIAYSGGAIASTIDDLHDYGVAFGEGYGLTDALKRARIDDSAPGDPTSGLGLVAQRDPASDVISIGHAGSEPGYGASLEYYPCSGTVFATMSNADVDPAMIEILAAVQPVVQELAMENCSPAASSSTR
jgi:D-alanyl-D-alanine carboxypeptidase